MAAALETSLRFRTRMALLGGGFALVVACTTTEARPPINTDTPSGIANGGGAADAAVDAADAGPSLCAEPSIVDGFVPLRTFYAAPTGSDSNDGTTPSSAWRSLRNAADLQPGDLLEIAPGSYPGGAVLRGLGTAGAPILIRARDGAGTVTVEGEGSAAALTLAGARYLAIDGLGFRGAFQDNVVVTIGNDGAVADHVLFRRITSAQAQAANFRAMYATNVDVRESLFDQPEALGPREEAPGLLFVGVSGAKIIANTFRNTLTDAALEIRGGSSNVLVDGNTFVDLADGLHLGGRTLAAQFADPTADYEAKGITAVNNRFLGAVSLPVLLSGCRDCSVAFNSFAARAAQVVVQSQAGGAGANAGVATSVSRDVRITSNLFAFQGPPPPSIFAIPAADQDGILVGPNLFYATGATVLAATSSPALDLGVTVVDQDPLLTNLAAADLTLLPGSPALGRGEVVTAVRRDGAGACRTSYNLGAF